MGPSGQRPRQPRDADAHLDDDRHADHVVDVVAHLVGLQAQAPWAPYTGLWTRVAGFAHADLADRLLDRTLVRIVAMRGTVHLLTADDALVLPTLVEPLQRAGLRVYLRWLVEQGISSVSLNPDTVVATWQQLAR